MFDTYASYIFSLFAVIIVIFQFALALGVPWGEMAMGGKYPGKFPPRMRIAALVQIVILVFFATIVLTRSGLILENYYNFSELAIWFVVAFSTLGAIMNTITPSKKERMLWAPVAIVMFLCVTYVALN
ncbi:hypothetical protein JYT97_04110 [Haliea sp. AH-315-K21]|uniref:Uncharacterized protein n=1 Tax=SAR86 cluster bacterium TaxID=2030880 RepID=A0A2A5CAE3_9GAMM|nr:hypothetical protein [Haliea sp. AH-315-K21]PCJ40461.1 MAG: hypothetical protein COA71_11460 [SAR86 cluster bacterium]